MPVSKNNMCEFCGKKHKWISSGTSFHGGYCIECLKLSRKEDADCLREIREVIKQNRIKINVIMQDLFNKLENCNTTRNGAYYLLEDLSKAELMEVCNYFSVYYLQSDNKDTLKTKIVESVVDARLRSKAIRKIKLK